MHQYLRPYVQRNYTPYRTRKFDRKDHQSIRKEKPRGADAENVFALLQNRTQKLILFFPAAWHVWQPAQANSNTKFLWVDNQADWHEARSGYLGWSEACRIAQHNLRHKILSMMAHKSAEPYWPKGMPNFRHFVLGAHCRLAAGHHKPPTNHSCAHQCRLPK